MKVSTYCMEAILVKYKTKKNITKKKKGNYYVNIMLIFTILGKLEG